MASFPHRRGALKSGAFRQRNASRPPPAAPTNTVPGGDGKCREIARSSNGNRLKTKPFALWLVALLSGIGEIIVHIVESVGRASQHDFRTQPIEEPIAAVNYPCGPHQPS